MKYLILLLFLISPLTAKHNVVFILTDDLGYAPTLTGQGEQSQHDYLYREFHEKKGRRAIQQGDWKLVEYNLSLPESGTTELFNLGDDPQEGNDLAKENPAKVSELTALMDKARVQNPRFPLPALDR